MTHVSLCPRVTLGLAITLCASLANGQADTQILDFLAPQPTWDNVEAESFEVPTAGIEDFVETDLQGLVATFSGLSQVANGNLQGLVNPAEDFRLRSFTTTTQIQNISRFNDPPTLTPGVPPFAGALQWAFDLTPLESYLSAEGLSLSALEANLDINYAAIGTSGGRTYDVLLSYTNAAENIALTSISTTVDPGQSGSATNGLILAASRDAGDGSFISPPKPLDVADFNEDGVVDAADYTVYRDTLGDDTPQWSGADANGSGTVNILDYNVWDTNYGAEVTDPATNTHCVVDSDVGNDVFASADNLTTIDLLSLYNAGVREFNVSILTSGFSPNGRSFNIRGPGISSNQIGSGVFISTSPAAVATPEPATGLLATMLLAGSFLLHRRQP